MIIIRQGKEYELSLEELQTAWAEFAEIKRKQIEEEEAERCRKDREWVRFQRGVAKELDYPINVLLSALYDRRDGQKFIEGSAEYKDDIIKGLLWAIDKLPDDNRCAIEYWYRDQMKYKEGAAVLGCTTRQFGQFRDKGIRLLYRSVRFYKAYHYGYKLGVEALENEKTA